MFLDLGVQPLHMLHKRRINNNKPVLENDVNSNWWFNRFAREELIYHWLWRA